MAQRRDTPHVVIAGGGFGGLYAATALRRAPVRVTLLDRRNFHLFQPLLYQVASGSLSPGDICSPLRAVLQKQKNTRVLMGTLTDILPDERKIVVDGREMAYDTLILATGLTPSYFGHDEWAAGAPGLKSLEDALEQAAREHPSGDFRIFVASVIIHRRSGGNLADMMERIAAIIRDRMRIARRVRTLTAQTQLSKRILIALPFFMFVLLNVLNPKYMQAFYDTPEGQIMLAIAGAAMLIGVWIMNKIAILRY